MAEHFLDRSRYHGEWNNAIAPRLTMTSGDSVTIETRDAANGQALTRFSGDHLAAIDPDLLASITAASARYAGEELPAGHPLTGPISIEGARPGDVLQIDIIDIVPGSWGFSAISPGFGLLANEFSERFGAVWDLRSVGIAMLKPGIGVPIDPFCGVMGLAPVASGGHATIPPSRVGGNLDIKQLTAGSTLYLPVEVAGGLLSIGDAHAAQGDGEVCGYGIECEATVTLRLIVRDDLSFNQPRFETFGPPLMTAWEPGAFATTGIGPDLYTASQDAIRAMIDHLEDGHGLTREEGYVLCSAAVDLKISEVVDAPNWVVSAFLPKGIFLA